MTVEAEMPSETQEAPAKGRSGARERIVTIVRRVLLAAVVIGAGYYLVTKWPEVWATLSSVPWYLALLSLVLVVLGILAGTAAWQQVVDDLGTPIGRVRGSQIYLVSQLGKYVPGAVWAYLLQMELGKKAGLARSRMFVASLVQVGVAVVVSLVVGLLALPILLSKSPGTVWLYAILPFGLVALYPRVMTWGVNLVLRVARRPPLENPLRWSTILKTLGFTVVANVLFGSHLWLLATASGGPKADVLLVCIGALSIGLTAGLFFFFLPSGAGVRDVLVALALAPMVGVVEGAAFAVASRVMFTVADIGTAGVAALIARVTHPIVTTSESRRDPE